MYRIKEKKEEVQSTINSGKIKANVVVQIGNIKVAVNEAGTRPMVLSKSVDISIQRPIMADEHVASSGSITTSKYFQPRWCPSGLTRTQKGKLQRLRCQEKKGQEAKKVKVGQLNKCRPIIPQSKVWQVKSADSLQDRSDRSSRLV